MKTRRMRHFTILVLASCVFAGIPAAASAQDALSRVKTFYESANYEEALRLLETEKGRLANTEAAAYRVFCLVALGRSDEAKAAVQTIVRIDPLFRLPEGQVSPRLRSFFEDIRKPLLPDIARQSYASAKTAFDKKDWAPAVSGFDQVISLLEEIGGADQGVSDLRTLAAGFRDLARAALQPPPAPEPPPAPRAAPAPAVPAEPEIYSSGDTGVKIPVARSKPLPEWHPTGIEERMSFVGAVELVVSEEGKVLSAKLIDSVHPRYDPLLLKAAAGWTFRPATKNGVPVKYRYSVAVQLGK